MTTKTTDPKTSKPTGAAAKAARQAGLQVTHSPETRTGESGRMTMLLPEPLPTSEASTDLATLVAARKTLDAQIKAAKAALPTATPLERITARQLAQPTKWLVAGLRGRVAARVAAGQPRDEAIQAVLAQYRALLESETDSEADTQATDAEANVETE